MDPVVKWIAIGIVGATWAASGLLGLFGTWQFVPQLKNELLAIEDGCMDDDGCSAVESDVREALHLTRASIALNVAFPWFILVIALPGVLWWTKAASGHQKMALIAMQVLTGLVYLVGVLCSYGGVSKLHSARMEQTQFSDDIKGREEELTTHAGHVMCGFLAILCVATLYGIMTQSVRMFVRNALES
jgi:hypothetical protein